MLTYCDSSAFVVLLRPDERDREPLVTASIREASAVAAIDWICPLEVCAAVNRSLPARSRRAAERRWWDIWSRIVPVAVVGALYEDALRVARRHRLRSLDALHLAAATRIGCARLLTFDVELAAAARDEKLDVVGV